MLVWEKLSKSPSCTKNLSGSGSAIELYRIIAKESMDAANGDALSCFPYRMSNAPIRSVRWEEMPTSASKQALFKGLSRKTNSRRDALFEVWDPDARKSTASWSCLDIISNVSRKDLTSSILNLWKQDPSRHLHLPDSKAVNRSWSKTRTRFETMLTGIHAPLPMLNKRKMLIK